MSDPTPKRRWFRFGLWTVFIGLVTIDLMLGAVQAHSWKSQRARFLQEREPTNGSGMVSAPFPLGLVGEAGYHFIGVAFIGQFDSPLTDEQELELDKVRRLFPEAHVEGHVMCAPNAPISPEMRRQLEGRLP